MLQAFRHLYVLAVEPRSIEAIDVDSRASVFVPLKVTLSPSSQVCIHSLPLHEGVHMPVRLPCTVICEVLCHIHLGSCVSTQVYVHSLLMYQGVHMPARLSHTVMCEVACHRPLGSYVSSLGAYCIAAVCLLLVGPEVHASYVSSLGAYCIAAVCLLLVGPEVHASYVSSLGAYCIAAVCLLLVGPEVHATCVTCKLCLSQKALNTSGNLMLQQSCILRPVTRRLSGTVLQVSGVASNELLATDPNYADRDGTAHSTDSGEGVTPAGPSFSRPAPCLLPESHQASPASSFETAHLQKLATHQNFDNLHLTQHKASGKQL